MNEDNALTIAAWVIVVLPIINLYFLRDGWRRYRRDPGRSGILLAIWGVKFGAWLFGVALAFFAARQLLGLPPFPLGGLSLALVVIAIELLPAYLYIVLSRYERSE